LEIHRAIWLLLVQFKTATEVDRIITTVIGCLGLILGIVCFFWMKELFVRLNLLGLQKSWQKYPIMGEKRKLIFKESGLILESDTFKINCQWNALTEVVEGKSVFVLRLFTGETKMIPKRIFTSENQLNEFCRLLYIDRVRD
jgi:hypothetical protein